MTDSNAIWRFTLSTLAIWRLTHLVAEEDGPWDLLVHFRAKLGNNVFGRLMDCFYCLSLWFSLPLSIWLASGWVGLILHWQALSGAACLLQRITQKTGARFLRVGGLSRRRNMCCGQKRSALIESRKTDPAIVRLHYCGGLSSAQLRGAVTGQLYQFSRPHPVQAVDWRDAALLMQTRMFRQVPCR